MKTYWLTVLSLLLFSTLLIAQKPVKESFAKDIALPGLIGDTIFLSGLKGRAVLVDFWASWCGPCRVTNRNLVALYQKHHLQGFEILSVSIDNDTSKWRAAVALDKMPWLQVNQRGGWQAPVINEWGVTKLPSSFLIGKEGKIVAIEPSYGVLDRWLEELLEPEKEKK